MGTAGRHLHALAIDLEALPRASLITVAKAVKKVAVDEAGRSRVAVMHLPRRGRPTRRAVRLRAVDTIREREGSASLRVQGVPVGLWVWANTGTGAHLIGAGKGNTRTTAASLRRARRRVPYLAFARDQVRRPPVYHPGHRGKHVWRRVQQRAAVIVPAIVRDEVARVCRG